MGDAAQVEVTVIGRWIALVGMLALATPAAAADRYALIVSGASGEPQYQQQYAQWRTSLVQTLTDTLKFDPAHIEALFEGADAGRVSTAANVRKAVERLRTRMHAEDVLLVVLLGHGTFDGVDAKFNLVGPDLSASEWAALLKPLPGHLTIVDTTASSFPFLERLSGPRRIVVSATDSGAQRFDTVFPQYFAEALGDPAADLDKNGRVSIWEAFISASLKVRRYYDRKGTLPTERAMLDDNGDAVGREAGTDGTDGSVAARAYLDADTANAAPTDEELLALVQRRTTLESDAEDLKERRALMTPDEYQKEFERLMLELARVSRDIRVRQKPPASSLQPPAGSR